MKPKPFELWLGGFFDGEGCIGVFINRENWWRLDVVIAQVDYNILKEILDIFPEGKISLQSTNGVHHLTYSNERCRNILNSLKETCRLKKKQVLVALEYLDLEEPDLWEKRLKIRKHLKRLKRD